MKAKILIIFFLIISQYFLCNAVKTSEEESILHTLIHIPHDPFVHSSTLPEYPYNDVNSQIFIICCYYQPSGIDLDVTYINRTPMYNRYECLVYVDGKPYLRPGHGK